MPTPRLKKSSSSTARKYVLTKRPKWWNYSEVGKYLKDQYRYIKSIKKVKVEDYILHLGAKNRSSLYNVFKGTLNLNPSKMKLYKTLFMFSQDEIEYLMLMTLRDKAQSKFEKKFWPKKINEFIKSHKKRLPDSNIEKSIIEEWDKFLASTPKKRGRKKS